MLTIEQIAELLKQSVTGQNIDDVTEKLNDELEAPQYWDKLLQICLTLQGGDRKAPSPELMVAQAACIQMNSVLRLRPWAHIRKECPSLEQARKQLVGTCLSTPHKNIRSQLSVSIAMIAAAEPEWIGDIVLGLTSASMNALALLATCFDQVSKLVTDEGAAARWFVQVFRSAQLSEGLPALADKIIKNAPGSISSAEGLETVVSLLKLYAATLLSRGAPSDWVSLSKPAFKVWWTLIEFALGLPPIPATGAVKERACTAILELCTRYTQETYRNPEFQQAVWTQVHRSIKQTTCRSDIDSLPMLEQLRCATQLAAMPESASLIRSKEGHAIFMSIAADALLPALISVQEDLEGLDDDDVLEFWEVKADIHTGSSLRTQALHMITTLVGASPVEYSALFVDQSEKLNASRLTTKPPLRFLYMSSSILIKCAVGQALVSLEGQKCMNIPAFLRDQVVPLLASFTDGHESSVQEELDANALALLRADAMQVLCTFARQLGSAGVVSRILVPIVRQIQRPESASIAPLLLQVAGGHCMRSLLEMEDLIGSEHILPHVDDLVKRLLTLICSEPAKRLPYESHMSAVQLLLSFCSVSAGLAALPALALILRQLFAHSAYVGPATRFCCALYDSFGTIVLGNADKIEAIAQELLPEICKVFEKDRSGGELGSYSLQLVQLVVAVAGSKRIASVDTIMEHVCRPDLWKNQNLVPSLFGLLQQYIVQHRCAPPAVIRVAQYLLGSDVRTQLMGLHLIMFVIRFSKSEEAIAVLKAAAASVVSSKDPTLALSVLSALLLTQCSYGSKSLTSGVFKSAQDMQSTLAALYGTALSLLLETETVEFEKITRTFLLPMSSCRLLMLKSYESLSKDGFAFLAGDALLKLQRMAELHQAGNKFQTRDDRQAKEIDLDGFTKLDACPPLVLDPLV